MSVGLWCACSTACCSNLQKTAEVSQGARSKQLWLRKEVAEYHLIQLALLSSSCRGGGSSIPCGDPRGLGGCWGSKGVGQLPERLHVLPCHPLDHLRAQGHSGLA